MLTHYTLTPLWCGIFIGPLGILEPYSGHVRSAGMHAYAAAMDDKLLLC